MTDKTDKTEVTVQTEEASKPIQPKPVKAKPKSPPKRIVKVSQEAEPVVSPPVVVAPAAATVSTAPKNRFQPSGKVKLIQASILAPHNAGLRFVLNLANLAGKMESPLYPLFEKKWPKVRQEVRGWYATKTGAYKYGAVHTVAVQSDVWVLSMLCQDEELQTDVSAVEKCLKEVCKMAKYERASLHISTRLVQAIPELPDLVTAQLVDHGVAVSYYEEPGTQSV